MGEGRGQTTRSSDVGVCLRVQNDYGAVSYRSYLPRLVRIVVGIQLPILSFL